jgi:U3 small nucleolar RNA-associated protein 14
MCTSTEHVILGDDKSNLRNLQLNNIPFPYTSVADFEASLRLPMGDTFIPRTSHKKMIQPKEKIPLGSLIEPMDRETLVKRKLVEPRIELEIKE